MGGPFLAWILFQGVDNFHLKEEIKRVLRPRVLPISILRLRGNGPDMKICILPWTWQKYWKASRSKKNPSVMTISFRDYASVFVIIDCCLFSSQKHTYLYSMKWCFLFENLVHSLLYPPTPHTYHNLTWLIMTSARWGGIVHSASAVVPSILYTVHCIQLYLSLPPLSWTDLSGSWWGWSSTTHWWVHTLTQQTFSC